MPTLSSSIVKHNVASVHDVEEALARQAMYGGDLATNLLELSAVSEEQLVQALAQSHDLPAAPAGELAVSPSEVRQLVPPELARRFGFYPLSSDHEALVIAVSEPLPGDVASDLVIAVGKRLEQRISMGVRVQQALARDYGVPLEPRALRILAKLAGLPDPNPSIAPEPEPEVAPDVTDSLRPLPASESESPAQDDSSSRRHQSRRPGAFDLRALAQRPDRARPSRRLGPYTPAMVEHDLLEAEGRDAALSAFFDFASQYFEYAALFAIHGDIAEGLDAAGTGASRARVIALGVPLDLPSALSRAAAGEQPLLSRLKGGGLDGALARDLERKPGRLSLLLPVRVRGRSVLVLYGDHGDHDLSLDSVGEVIAFAPLVAQKLEQLILKRKGHRQGQLSAPPPAVTARPAKTHELPGAEQRAQALTAALAQSQPPPEVSPRRTATLSHPVIAIGHSQAAPRTTTSPETSLPAPASYEPRLPSRRSTPVMPIHSLAPPAAPAPGALAEPPSPSAKPRLELLAGNSDLPALIGEGTSEHRPAAAFAPAEEPEVSFGPATDEPDDRESEPYGPGVPLAPASRALSYSARPLPAPMSTEELQLPTVIVDLAHDCQALLEQLLAGDPTAGDKLVQVGEPAIAVLVGAFPGPITASLRRGVSNSPSRASECGPLLRTLSRLGTRAVPMLVVRTADGDPIVRAWATRLLGEMSNEEAARAVVRRFVDQEQEVRRAALAAGRLMQANPEARAMLQLGLAELLADPSRPEDQRHALLEATADLRDGRAIPTVIRLLEDRQADVVRSAHWALVVLARQDFGRTPAAWEEWWRINGARHRIEWLIDALLHDSADIRRAAGDELKSTTKEYFGYYDDLPVGERLKAQTRYREWWDSKGKARFW